jgi:hypothetical protein
MWCSYMYGLGVSVLGGQVSSIPSSYYWGINSVAPPPYMLRLILISAKVTPTGLAATLQRAEMHLACVPLSLWNTLREWASSSWSVAGFPQWSCAWASRYFMADEWLSSLSPECRLLGDELVIACNWHVRAERGIDLLNGGGEGVSGKHYWEWNGQARGQSLGHLVTSSEMR